MRDVGLYSKYRDATLQTHMGGSTEVTVISELHAL